MEKIWNDIAMACVMGLLVPGVLLGSAVKLRQMPVETEPATEPTIAEESAYELPVLWDGVVQEMELSDYLTGVVLAEMPASFETEALKAQAVVARTYAIRSWERGKKHDGAAVCTDSTCCQGYISEEDYLAKGGTRESVEKICRAVEETENLVLTYQGELIEATYFSCSGGSTEDAAAVWGMDVAYLQAVESPGEERATHYTDQVTFPAEEFSEWLDIKLTGKPENWFGAVTYTDGGGVDTMTIGGTVFKGTTLRSLLGLRSTAFSVAVEGNMVVITTRGYGHRVGMSQYGADAMAVTGSTYDEILAHYYQGTQLEQWFH